MTLIRALFFICVRCNFECAVVYILSKCNVLADALSRGDMEKLRVNCNNAEKMFRCVSCNILDILCNYR